MSNTPARKNKTPSKKTPSSANKGGGGRNTERWVPLPGASAHVRVPSTKVATYPEDLGCIEAFVSSTQLPGGVITEGGSLYACVTAVEGLQIGDHHLPMRRDSCYAHPDTMQSCGMTIASPVVIRNTSNHGALSVCKVWPLASLQLDAVALNCSALLGCGVEEMDTRKVCVEVCRAVGLSSISRAGKVLLQACHKVDYPVTESFKSYLLHSHDGHYVSEGSYIAVTYYGEDRLFKVVEISPELCDDTLAENLSNLSLNEPKVLKDIAIFKISSSRTKLELQPETPPPGAKGRGLEAIGGMRTVVQLLKELVLYPLQNPVVKGLSFPHGVLLYGPAGVGKSLLAEAITTESGVHCIHLSPVELRQDPETTLLKAFADARQCSPCLLVLDDLHAMCLHRDHTPSEKERTATSILTTQLDAINRHPPPAHVVVMATTNQIEAVDPSLRRPGHFDREVEVPVPTATERKEILFLHLCQLTHSLTEEQIAQLAEVAHGYVGADLTAVCLQAQHKALQRSLKAGSDLETMTLSWEDLRGALSEVRPSAMREVAIEVPKVLWSDIGGQLEVKERMREAVEWPLKHPDAFARLGISPPKGVLLYGPPGCSKTMVARALATESGLNFLAVKGPELFSKWVGDSERAVRQLFSRARAVAPAIIFFDEIDALAVQRKSESSSVAERVLAQLLTEMDGVQSLQDVLVVAATNRPDLIDKALLRPGRIDKLIYVPLPSKETRKEILQLQFRKTPVAPDLDVDWLASQTENFSGAEVVSLVQEAALCAMHESISSSCVQLKHFEQALEVVTPQTDLSMIHFYDSYRKNMLSHK